MNQSNSRARVLVVSPHELIRTGLAQLVLAAPGRVDLVRGVPSGGRLDGVDVAVYDLVGLEGGAADVQHLLRSGTCVVGLARTGRPDLTRAAEAVGVRQFVPEDVTALGFVARLEDAVGRAQTTRSGGARRAELAKQTLSERERDCLQLVAQGRSNLEIAQELYVSVNSVKTYVRAAYKKIGVHSRTQAVLWVFEHGLAAPKS